MILPTQEEIVLINQYLSTDKLINNQQWSKLYTYVQLLLEENEKHNLIGKNTVYNVWTRHILDSIQLVSCIDKNNVIFDLGSGAGFPAIVLGIAINQQIIMVEKSPVKAKFLDKVCTKLNLKFKIINENINKDNIGLFVKNSVNITSRAFKSMNEILSLFDDQHMIKNINRIILLKGERWCEEMSQIDKCILNNWRYKVEQSVIGNGVIIIFQHNFSAHIQQNIDFQK